jgi:hypothetical protein
VDSTGQTIDFLLTAKRDAAARIVKVFMRLGSNIEASRRVAPDNELFGGTLPPPGQGRVGRFLCPDDFSPSDNAR